MSNSSFYDFHCPTGGKWYACATGSKFVGCCATDPCVNGCQQGNIRAGGYNISHYGEWPGASCGIASDFYTCNAGDSFWGCCKSNPCAATPPATCASGDLVPAFMDRPEQFSVYASGVSIATPSASETSTASPAKSNTGAIVGGVVGGVVALAIIGLIAFFVLRKRRNQKAAGGDMGASAMIPMMNNEKHDHNRHPSHFDGQSPPPTYSAPVQGAYQHDSPTKGHQTYQYAHHASEPQELPADMSSSNTHRYSELPAGVSDAMDTRRFSELPAEATRVGPSELESPQVSPMPVQGEFSSDKAKRVSRAQGLGVMTEESPSGRH